MKMLLGEKQNLALFLVSFQKSIRAETYPLIRGQCHVVPLEIGSDTKRRNPISKKKEQKIKFPRCEQKNREEKSNVSEFVKRKNPIVFFEFPTPEKRAEKMLQKDEQMRCRVRKKEKKISVETFFGGRNNRTSQKIERNKEKRLKHLIHP